MAEEFQGGVCGSTWWNPPRSTLFSGGLTSPCWVAELGGGFDMGTFGWPNEVLINKPTNLYNSLDNSLAFQADLDFGLSTSDWRQSSQLINCRNNDVNYESIFPEDEHFKINRSIFNNFVASHENVMDNFNNNSSPMVASVNSNTLKSEGGLLTHLSFRSLYAYSEDSHVLEPQSMISQLTKNSNTGHSDVIDSRPSREGMNLQNSPAPRLSYAHVASDKGNTEEIRDSKSDLNDHQSLAKRPRIETPSPLPSFKVRKEKQGDRITALQQLVSPFGKTDTASVLHEAVDYIKFLLSQVSGLSTPYLKNRAPMDHHQENKEESEDLRSRGLCIRPVSSTYAVVQETSIDFWTHTFGGPEFS